MAKRRVSDVVDERQSFDQINIQSELGCDRPRDLRDFKGVRQAISKVVGVSASENLGLGFEAAESSRVNYAVTVSLKIIAIRMRRLRVAAATGVLHRVGSKNRMIG